MRNWIPILLIVATGGCDTSPAPVAPPVEQKTASQAVEAPKPRLPAEEHALLNRLPDLLPASVDVIVATANPAELARVLGDDPPSPSTLGQRPPELEDLHPSRLAAYGIDPSRPAGVFSTGGRFGVSARWGVFGHVKDPEKMIAGLGVTELPALAGDGADVKRYSPRLGSHRLAIIGDVALLTHHVPVARTSALAEEESFQKLSGALDYGALATAYVAGDEPVMVGLGVTKRGFAVRAVAADEERAQDATQRWFEHLYDLDLNRETGGVLAAMMFGSPTEKQLEKNKKLRKAHTALEEAKEQLEVLEQAPTERRKAALAKAFGELETDRVDREASGELHVVTSFVTAPTDFGSTLMTTLAELDFTEDETAELKKLQKKHDKLRDDVSRMSSPFASIGSFEFDSKLSENALGGLIGSEIGDSFGSGGLGLRGTGRGGGGTGEGTLGLGSYGAIGHGGGGGSGYGRVGLGTRAKRPTATLSSASDPLLREHARKRIGRVRTCYNLVIDKGEEFDGTITSSVSIADGRVSVSKTSGGSESLNGCVQKALIGAVDTEASASGTVAFRLEKK